MREIQIGSISTAELLVRDADLASALSLDADDQFPPVFATSRMVALMELAAARVLRPGLEDGELSVGVTLDVTHSAATEPGVLVTATAKLTALEGKLYVFEVEARDPAGEIGRAVHRRAVISEARLLAGAAKRSAVKG